MKKYVITIEVKFEEGINEDIERSLDVDIADAVYQNGGEVIDIKEYIEID